MNRDRAQIFAALAVSVDAAHRAARDLGIPVSQELCRYVIHGVLHLCGYDDATAAGRKRMWKRQEALLKSVRL